MLVRDDSGTGDWREAGIWYTAGGNTVLFADPREETPEEFKHLRGKELQRAMELAPPVRVIRTSNRRWEEDEFMIPQSLTEGRERVRLRLEFMPVKLPLFPGHPVADEAWTEYRYQAYCFVMPRPADSEN